MIRCRSSIFLLLGFLLYSCYSFVHVDVNLILTSQPLLLDLVTSLQQWALNNRSSSTILYSLLIAWLFVGYLWVIRDVQQKQNTFKELVIYVLSVVIVLSVSYPALSYDIYNYLFNAKMVLIHQANPHIQVATDFAPDPWLLHMRNVHTPAPYGYGWTLLSLLPGSLGLINLKLGILGFRMMMIGFFMLMIWVYAKTVRKEALVSSVALFSLNPLVLIETISNVHNDVVMMGLLMLGMYLIGDLSSKLASPNEMVGGLVAILASISIKLATITAVPVIVLRRIFSGVNTHYFALLALALFTPLLTPRSQQFLPWYLIWPLTFLPYIRSFLLRLVLASFSFSSLISYGPYLWYGEYTSTQNSYRLLLQFGIPLMVGVLWSMWHLKTRRSIPSNLRV